MKMKKHLINKLYHDLGLSQELNHEALGTYDYVALKLSIDTWNNHQE